MKEKKPESINDYISRFPESVQRSLNEVRNTVRKAAPGAEEKISYAMPAFTLDKKNLVYFAGYENHIGLYPAPAAMASFKKDFAKYKTGKGSVQFPLDQPMPLALITKIVKYRIKENNQKTKTRKK
jgi:uncharacterized protein YdhG (YjbR/CyaY superfamily)